MRFCAFLVGFMTFTGNAATPQPRTTPPSLPFNVACTNITSAILTLTDPKKTIAGKGACNPTQTTGTYTLDKDCLNGETFIVGLKLTVDNKNFLTDGKEYKVSCTESKDPIIVTVSSNLTVNGPNGSPVEKTIPFSSKKPLFMTLLTIKPDKDTITDKGLTNAQLGTSLYLTIVEDKGNLKLLPLSCVASTTKTGETTIWSYANHGLCTYEHTIFKAGFKNIDTEKSQRVMFAELKAFRFAEDSTGMITFTCKVQECRTSDGDCPQDLSACTAPTTQKPNGSSRRRRNVDDAKIHHLTARLRITEDFAVHDGSDSVHYALSGVLLSVLIQIIL